MGILESGFLLSYSFHTSCSSVSSSSSSSSHNPSLQNLTIFKPIAKSQREHSKILNFRDTRQSDPKTHFALTPKPPNYKSLLSIEHNSAIDKCLHLLNTKSPTDCRQIHCQFVKLGSSEFNNLIANKLVILYSKSKGLLDAAQKLFDETHEKTVPTYAALIGSYSRFERWDDLFAVFGLMVNDGLLPDKYLIPTILKACAAMKYVMTGRMVHAYVLRKVLEMDLFVENALIDLYANCGDLRYSRSTFDTMQERDVVSWTALLSAYLHEGLLDEAENVFRSMKLYGVKPDLICWSALVSGYAQNGEVDLALQVLEEMKEKGMKPGVNTLNGMISGFVHNGHFEDALEVFIKMLHCFEDPNFITIASILPACAGLQDLNLGKAVHGYAIKNGIWGNVYVEGSLINMYSKCGKSDTAEKVFVHIKNKNTALYNEMIAAYVNEGNIEGAFSLLQLMQKEGLKPDLITYNTLLAGYSRKGQKNDAYELLSQMVHMNLKPNIVSINALISGFQQSGLTYDALKLFRFMQSPFGDCFSTEVLNAPIQPNSITTASALAACADLALLRQGKEIHGYITRNNFEPNIILFSALVDMYMKCLDMDSATMVFWRIMERNTVSWNAFITGHINSKQPEEAFKLLDRMLGEGVKPNSVTYILLLQACADMAVLESGRAVHSLIIRSHLGMPDTILASALLDMYSKCSSLQDAKTVFDSEVEKDVALWNAMISTYSLHGFASNAINLFQQMDHLGIRPDKITFISILSACAHDGLVEEGWKYFNMMSYAYGFSASLEHYTCMVGIMGTAGLLNEALDFIRQMPYAPDACTWATLLRACRVHSNPEIGEIAAEALFKLEPKNASNYILLSNIYVSAGMWDLVKNLRSVMRGQRLIGIEECSSICLDKMIYEFKGGKSNYSKLEETLDLWDGLAEEMGVSGYDPLDPVFEDEEEIDLLSCLHTEKLAVCSGILFSNNHHPIRVRKNLRMCIDCHTSVKLISKIVKREIFVKDASFYHHMRDGICSCRDRW
ncbi:Pentatricopeptide repeat [Dillenia turbinata]|uniref:Pentatricopeptide repeat n=1 Tax=Dillenia turbinata TaxID=194707 RepID=A0AAN8VTH9_9MAGN